MLFRRNYDGHIVSMHQAGTHWIRNLAAQVIVREFSLPEPEHIRSDAVVGGPNKIPVHHGPKIVQSHKIPGPIFSLPIWRRFLKFPKYVVLIRDPRVSIASHYKKHHKGSQKSFSEFLRLKGKDDFFLKDIWDDIRFLNTWVALAKSWPQNVLVVRYEDLRKDTVGKLKEIFEFLNIPLKLSDSLEWSVQQCSKQNMANREAPARKNNIVRPDEINPLSIYSPEDQAYFLEVFQHHLKVAIPYDLNKWTA